MKTKAVIITVLLSIILVLSACGPNEGELNATGTAVAEDILGT